MIGSDKRHQLRVILSVAAAYTLAILPSWVQPYLIMELVNNYAMDESSAGLVATVEASAIAITSMVCARVAAPFAFIKSLICGVILIVVGNLSSLFVDAFTPLIVTRTISGIGAGTLLMVSSAAIASFKDTDRAYAQINAASVISGLVVYGIVPVIVGAGISHIAFTLLLLFVVFLIPVVFAMPRNAAIPKSVLSDHENSNGYLSLEVLLISLAILLSCGILASSWAFYFILGERVGLSSEQINTAMIYVVVSALFGTLLVSFFGQKYGRLGPLTIAIVIMTISIVSLGLSQHPIVYRIFSALNIFGFYIFVPLFLGYAATADTSGRGVAVVSGVYLAGTAVGPYLGGIVVSWWGIEYFAWIALFANSISLVLFLVVHSRLCKPPNQSRLDGPAGPISSRPEL